MAREQRQVGFGGAGGKIRSEAAADFRGLRAQGSKEGPYDPGGRHPHHPMLHKPPIDKPDPTLREFGMLIW